MRAVKSEPSSSAAQTRWCLALAALTALTLFVHGFHPLAEDGGLYVAGIKWLLDPALFPHDAAFVREHLRFSLFAPFIAACVRTLHFRLLWVLLLVYVASIAATLAAARALLRACGASPAAQLGGVTLLAAWWTMPVAGTSLLLMDPYVTARSLSTPLCLWALAITLGASPRALAKVSVLLLVAAAFHPLMAVYGLGFVLAVLITRSPNAKPLWLALAALCIAVAALLQALTAPESPAVVAAAYSRYYWFLSQWQWFELLGLAGPLLVLAALFAFLRPRWNQHFRELIHAALLLSLLSVVIALVFAHESFRAHAVARLQPLRVYLETYALLALIGGGALAEYATTAARQRALAFAALAIILIGSFAGFFALARATYPSSAQVEWPWRANTSPNPWVQAFLWARHNTPPDAVFALDAKYVNTDGEDAQTFRAIAERSMVPDFSKDGGEAAITPALADTWQRGAAAQKDLSTLSDTERDARLHPWGVTWMVLHANAPTAHPCPYSNAVVKVCSLITQ